MGHGDERTGVATELFKRGLGFHVEVIGRLVHQEKVVFFEQEFEQSTVAPPTEKLVALVRLKVETTECRSMSPYWKSSQSFEFAPPG